MSGARPPIKFQEVCNLPQIGLPAAAIKIRCTTLESEKYVSVRDEADNNAIHVVDLTSKTEFIKLPVPGCESAIMNPVSKVIAVRVGPNNLQVLNIEMKSKLKAAQMSDPVEFWCWLNVQTIAIVTSKSVYHWSMDADAQPQKMYDRPASDPNMKVQIMSYSVSADNKWCMLGGVQAGPQGLMGYTQLYSVERKSNQNPIDAYAACFASTTLDRADRTGPSTLLVFTKKAPTPAITIVELGVDKEKGPHTASAQINLADPSDFPVYTIHDPKHDILFLLTRSGFLHMIELTTGNTIFANKASQGSFFVACRCESSGGIYAVDTTGRVAHFSVDDTQLVSYITSVLNMTELGLRMAVKHNLPGADGFFKAQFERHMSSGNIAAAAKLAVEAPQGVLRTLETIQRFQRCPPEAGKPPAVFQYFTLLLQKGKLNRVESIELCRPLIQTGQTGIERIQKMIQEDKLDHSEELGDLLKNLDPRLACSVYLRANAHEAAIACFLQLGQYAKVLQYAKSVNFRPDYSLLLSQLHRVRPDDAKNFAVMLALNPEDQGGALVDVNTVIEIFMQTNHIESTTGFLMEYLKSRGDREEDAFLQTRLLELALLGGQPQIANFIFDSHELRMTHYNKTRIAQLCERAQLYQRALENYSELEDIRRVIVNTHMIDKEFLLNFFGTLSPEDGLTCLADLLKFNIQTNIVLAVDVCKRYSEQMGPMRIIGLFDEFKSPHGVFYYVGSFINTTTDADVIFKYVEAAVKLNQVQEAERICRDNNYYEPKQVKEFLLKANLKDPRPLIHLCDRYNFVDELTRFLYNNNMQRFIEVYVQKMNPVATPIVIGTLLDLNTPDDVLRTLLNSVPPPAANADPTLPPIPSCPIKELVEEVQKRNRLRLLQPWLEARMQDGNVSVDLHNALAITYVDNNQNPQQFLLTNRFYDSRVVGKHCEASYPHLAVLAYKRAAGQCDRELVEVTNKNGFFKDQAKYLVEQKNLELWDFVLQESNQYRRNVIDQVVASALPDSRVPEEVSTTVQAFMKAQLHAELIELLEKIVLHGPVDSVFHNNKNLQNLLLLTAIKADKLRVKDYINRLDNYDGPDIAKIAVSEQHKLYEEAFLIYQKFKKGPEAINVLIYKMEDLARAADFADQLDDPAVWSILANAQLDNFQVKESIESFLKANDAKKYEEVIAAATREELFEGLIKYLLMVRQTVREPLVDSELLYSFARTDKLAQLDEFIAGTSSLGACLAKIESVGDRLYEDGMYEAARIIFTQAQLPAKLALCYVHLNKFQEAVDACRKANNINTWKQVCYACVKAQEFRLAQVCGLNIVVYMDHLADLVRHYEVYGYFEEVITLLEAGINLDRAHQGIYTQLGVLYAKYKDEKLMEHIKFFNSRLNIPTLLQACKDNLHWSAAVFLYTQYDQFDNAVDLMITHSSECWEHNQFKEIVVKASNTEVFYKAISFYLQEHSLMLNDLLVELAFKLDHTRVVLMFRKEGHLPLIQKYLLVVQRENLSAVNEAVNQLYIEDENHVGLKESIDSYDQFDQLALAKQCEKHEVIFFRKIAAYLYKKNKRWAQSVELYKKDLCYAEAMETAADSRESSIAEDLLRFFVDRKLVVEYSACLFACYDLLRTDIVLELAWRHKLTDLTMPFMIQTFRDINFKLNDLSNKIADRDKADAEAKAKAAQDSDQNAAAAAGAAAFAAPVVSPYLALPAPSMAPSFVPPVTGMGMMPPASMSMGGMPPMGMPPMGFGGQY